MNRVAWGALAFVVLFFGLGVATVVLLLTLTRGRDGASSGGYVVGDVGGVPVRVGS